MKIKARYALLALTVMILVVTYGMLFAVEPVMVKKPISLQGVYVSKTPPTQLAPPEQNLPPAPAPLTAQFRASVINQIRTAVGLTALPQPTVPAHVVLTPAAPRSGGSYYNIHDGNNSPMSGISFMPKNVGWLWFDIETIPGKVYMVDLFIYGGYGGQVNIAGAYNGVTSIPSNHHLIIGFTANSAHSGLHLKSYTVDMLIYRFEVTQVS